MDNVVALCGMCCLGKTYFLQLCQSKGYKVLFTDFNENINRNKMFREKHSDKFLQIFYTEFVAMYKYLAVQHKHERIIQD